MKHGEVRKISSQMEELQSKVQLLSTEKMELESTILENTDEITRLLFFLVDIQKKLGLQDANMLDVPSQMECVESKLQNLLSDKMDFD